MNSVAPHRIVRGPIVLESRLPVMAARPSAFCANLPGAGRLLPMMRQRPHHLRASLDSCRRAPRSSSGYGRPVRAAWIIADFPDGGPVSKEAALRHARAQEPSHDGCEGARFARIIGRPDRERRAGRPETERNR
jgi:hypothetical protein